MKIYPRSILPNIEKILRLPEIIVIHGARQVGKSTIINILMDNLKNKNKPENIIYFDLEDFELVDLCNEGAKAVIEHLKARKCNFNKKIYLFIDEIQYLENPSSFLKYFYDHHKIQVKLIVTGSSSFAIKSKFRESLVGRTINFELFGLTFEEFLIFKNKSYDLKTSDKIVIKELKKLWKEFIFYGSYPRIVLERSVEMKEKILKQIINTYIKKDIKDLANIADINKFNRLIKILASQSGQMLNILELSNTTNIARPTLENYLMILENTYIIKLITPFHKNIRSELTKMPKIYFEDLGLKNILEKGEFSKKIYGQDLETVVYSEFRKRIDTDNIHYWRTVKKEEVDFIINNKKMSAYEIKINARNKDRFSLNNFKKNYAGAKTYLVGFDFVDGKKIGNFNFIYPWQIDFNL